MVGDDAATEYLEAVDAIQLHVTGVVVAAYARGTTWPEQVRLGLQALLRCVAEDPQGAHAAFIEPPATGVEGRRRRDAGLRRFETLLAPGFRLAPEPPAGRRVVLEMVTGGVLQLIHARVTAGDCSDFEALLPTAVFHCLCPFLGPQEARREAELAAAAAAAAAAA
jgi:hypothetical protein